MNSIKALAIKELRSFFLSPIAYVFIVVFLVSTNFLFFQDFFLRNQADMRSYFSLLPWVFLIFIPAITMRCWAEEKKNKTLELLLTWPITDTEVVLGKFIASLVFLAITLLFTGTIPITIALLGDPDGGVIVASYLGALLLGGTYIALGMWVSSLTENQIVAFIGAFVLIFIFVLVGHGVVTAAVPLSLVPLLSYIGVTTHFESLSRGVIDSRDLIYFFSLGGFFLFLNMVQLDSRKWEK